MEDKSEDQEGIERLRESKLEIASRDDGDGVAMGKKWALNYAAFDELERVADLDVSQQITTDDVRCAIASEDWRDCNPFGDKLNDDIAAGFVKGAIEVLSQV